MSRCIALTLAANRLAREDCEMSGWETACHHRQLLAGSTCSRTTLSADLGRPRW